MVRLLTVQLSWTGLLTWIFGDFRHGKLEDVYWLLLVTQLVFPLNMMFTYSSNQWGIVCKCAAQPHTHKCAHSHSPWIELLFIGLQIGVMSWPRRWHHSAPAAPPHGTILMGVMWLWTIWSNCHGESSTWPWIMENHSWITQNPTEKKERGSR